MKQRIYQFSAFSVAHKPQLSICKNNHPLIRRRIMFASLNQPLYKICLIFSVFVEKKTCYRDLGCFSSGPPFYHPVYRPLSAPPQPPEIIKTMFMLYTRKNRNRPIMILPHRPQAIKKSTFNPSAITRMIIHGFNDNLVFTTWIFVSSFNF